MRLNPFLSPRVSPVSHTSCCLCESSPLEQGLLTLVERQTEMAQVLRVPSAGREEREQKEFWKPERPNLLRARRCDNCGNELFLGSRFCHLCGSGAERNQNGTSTRSIRSLAFAHELGTPSLICAGIGLICVVAALFVGFIYTASTALDWQAIQTWRMEWLLGALVAFAAGILLKRC